MQMQLYLQQLIPAMEFGIALMMPLSVLFAILTEYDNGRYRSLFRKTAYWGFWLSLFFIAVKQGTKNAISREGFEGIMAFFAIISEIVLASMLIGNQNKIEQRSSWFKRGVILHIISLSLYYGMEIWLVPVTTMLNVNEMFSITMIVRMLGFISGGFLAFVGSWLIYHAARSLNDKRLTVVYLIQLTALFLQQLVYIIQILMARHILPTRQLLVIMGPIIDHQRWVVFVVFLVLFTVPLALFSQKCPVRHVEQNPAQYRKVVAKDMHKKRWGKASVGILVVMILFSTFGYTYATKEEELIPAIAVTAENNKVSLEIEKVDDGHLHRFSYRTKNGTSIRFIIVRKGGSAYGVGLDCCEICGPTGYIERDDQVVCKLCDVVMNKQTIGMPGGCNPIPLSYGVADGKLHIEQEDLEAAEKYFR